MSENIIEAKNIHKSFKKFKAVNGIDFRVKRSSCFGFLGPNGAGKTTTMKMIYGRCTRDKNKSSILNVQGFDPQKNPLNVRFISGIVPQDDNLDEELSVLQNLLVYSKFYGMAKKEAVKRIEYLLDFLELSTKANNRPKALSGGMKRRLIIARALLHQPKLLILDEPTTGLDPQVRQLIWKKLRELKRNGMTILLTTHYMDEAFQICDEILLLDNGKKILEGSPQKLLKEHLESYVLEIIKEHKKLSTLEVPISSKIRREDVHDIPFYYSNNFDALRALAAKFEEGGYFLRQTNLEDLFIKKTGRSLNEHQ